MVKMRNQSSVGTVRDVHPIPSLECLIDPMNQTLKYP